MNSKGSILVSVIWMLIMLTIFSLAVSHAASQELQFANSIKNRTLGRALARAGVERALYEIQNDKLEGYDSYDQNWGSNEDAFKDRPLGQGFFTVNCDGDPESKGSSSYGACDESARVNINTANEATLKNLYLALLPKVEEESEKFATAFAQCVIDWRDVDDQMQTSGAEDNEYKSLPDPYEPRNGPFESVEELMMVKGVDRALFDKMKSYITVYSEGPVNFNTAPYTVLRALGLGQDLAKKVIEYRQGQDKIIGTEDDQFFTDSSAITSGLSAAGSFSGEEFEQISNAVSAGLVGVKSDTYRIHSFGRLNKDEKSQAGEVVSCVVKRDGTFLYWKEGEN